MLFIYKFHLESLFISLIFSNFAILTEVTITWHKKK